jgi:hypothetical protein
MVSSKKQPTAARSSQEMRWILSAVALVIVVPMLAGVRMRQRRSSWWL